MGERRRRGGGGGEGGRTVELGRKQKTGGEGAAGMRRRGSCEGGGHAKYALGKGGASADDYWSQD